MSERHLRRAVERELGVSPVELAQTHRLLLAKQLLADTSLSITRVAYASGFQSLRRFNATFRERYRMPPSLVRRNGNAKRASDEAEPVEPVRLTLAYRPPLPWDALLATLGRTFVPGVESIENGCYTRTVSIDRYRGVVSVHNVCGTQSRRRNAETRRGAGQAHLEVRVSPSLLPALMPLLAQLRRLFDLDAEPTVVDQHLAQDGLASLVRQRPGVRVPGAMDGFEIALVTILHDAVRNDAAARRLVRRIVQALGEPFVAGFEGLDRLAPGAARVADAGAARLQTAGVPRRAADMVARLARLVEDRTIRLYPGCDVEATYGTLRHSLGLDELPATMIVMRALSWPDAFPVSPDVWRKALSSIPGDDATISSERWRPWRAYAATHLVHAAAQVADHSQSGTSAQGVLLSRGD